MKTRHITGTEWENYSPVRRKIVELYNESSDVHYEQPELDFEAIDDHSALHCFSIDGIGGGVLVEQLVGNESCAIITFAAIEPLCRGKGVGSELVSLAEETLRNVGIRLIGVQMNAYDKPNFWYKFGFTELVPFGNGVALIQASYFRT
ncbi:GNAT family N-acetyltransferase [Vibrio sp. 10N]|uniref:GNAT family N-acetyltransferase n=1 Tax=Vibrio sp. 10N TaxID=3058938 RepID=UPI0028137359|nr:hypothetical protein VB10N_46480 [Vibrio sp. 10N]